MNLAVLFGEEQRTIQENRKQAQEKKLSMASCGLVNRGLQLP
jgi:hypothetical protein